MKLFALLAFLIPAFSWADSSVSLTQPGYYATYSAGAAAVSPPATPTDICEIAVSSVAANASRVIKVTHVDLSSTQSTAGLNVFYLVKRSTNDTGPQTALTSVPHDSTMGSSAATVFTYTANPTAGTSVGNVRTIHLLSAAPAGTNFSPQQWVFDQDLTSQPVTLRQGQSLSINFGGAALPTGLSVNCNFEWTEQ